MPRHDDRVYVAHMRDACAKVRRLVAGMTWAGFGSDERTPDAAIRQLEVLGEASSRVSEPFRVAHGNVPWRVLKDVRNLLIHGYDDVALDRVWAMATEDVPTLLTTLEELLLGR